MTYTLILCDGFILDKSRTIYPEETTAWLIENMEILKKANNDLGTQLIEKIYICQESPGFIGFISERTLDYSKDFCNVRLCAVFEDKDTAMIAKLSL